MKVYWLEQGESDVPSENDWLSVSDAACLNAMRFPKRRADWRLGRWTAKRALSIYLNAHGNPQGLARIEVRPAASGAPEAFIANEPADATISLSHSSGTAVCAVGPAGIELGCDLEIIEARSDAFVADYFTDDERALIATASASDRFLLIALLWSAKESALKALREGLRLDTRCVTVRLLETPRISASDEETAGSTIQHCSTWRPLEVHCISERMFQGWWRQTGSLIQTLVAASAPARPILLDPDGSHSDVGAASTQERPCHPI